MIINTITVGHCDHHHMQTPARPPLSQLENQCHVEEEEDRIIINSPHIVLLASPQVGYSPSAAAAAASRHLNDNDETDSDNEIDHTTTPAQYHLLKQTSTTKTTTMMTMTDNDESTLSKFRETGEFLRQISDEFSSRRRSRITNTATATITTTLDHRRHCILHWILSFFTTIISQNKLTY